MVRCSSEYNCRGSVPQADALLTPDPAPASAGQFADCGFVQNCWRPGSVRRRGVTAAMTVRVQFRATMGRRTLADLSRNDQVEVKAVDSAT